MKQTLSLIVLAAALGGCSSVYVPKVVKVPVDGGVPVLPVQSGSVSTAPTTSYHLANSHWSDVAKIRDEATRLSYQVSQGSITKVQAAQYLDKFRTQLVGRNPVDDDMYTIYLRSAVDSQRGAITTEQSKYFIQNALRGWQQRWPNMRNKPSNPAFTNFLMEIMSMKPLQ
ncbi:prokaryotic membrane lipolipid attachment site family protein [Snodgrassella sp. CFCC 13594]|jgi:hypothetical protein|uniref:prokaryotic membrane lipolipid attachment site family protein n=1 Tax=Snodgrassella sp. CFCC 13594 TaxID=1775559 RepID=UPI000835406B|nr:prokaryotic membrane lipolipid attachment site family protein [Snodgrassella sp. CFCC 13594]